MGFPLETLPAQMGQVLPKGALESRELLGNHHALLSLDDPTVCVFLRFVPNWACLEPDPRLPLLNAVLSLSLWAFRQNGGKRKKEKEKKKQSFREVMGGWRKGLPAFALLFILPLFKVILVLLFFPVLRELFLFCFVFVPLELMTHGRAH